MNTDKLLVNLLLHEGGYVDHPADKGGPTNHGITAAVYADFLGVTYEKMAEDDFHYVKEMKQSTACAIYLTDYYHGPKINLLAKDVQGVVFDMAVNHGPYEAIKMLQRALNDDGAPTVSVDGVIGPITAQATHTTASKNRLINSICDHRERFYRDIVKRDFSQNVFLNGWLKRCDSFRK